MSWHTIKQIEGILLNYRQQLVEYDYSNSHSGSGQFSNTHSPPPISLHIDFNSSVLQLLPKSLHQLCIGTRSLLVLITRNHRHDQRIPSPYKFHYRFLFPLACFEDLYNCKVGSVESVTSLHSDILDEISFQ